MNKLQTTLGAILVAATGCGQDGGPSTALSEIPQTLRLECAADSSGSPRDTWACPESVQVECPAAESSVLRVSSPSDQVCDADALSVSHDEPLTPGTHSVSVRDAQDAVLCTSQVVVHRSSQLRLVPKAINLWPPNHKLHEIHIEDCVDIVGACPGEKLTPRFIWASSDEPEDALGDGHSAPDITVSANCQQLSLRSERQGPSDGRVYTLGVRLVDAAGDAYEAACNVSVDHDQSGEAASTSPAAYRLTFDGKTSGVPSCVDDDAVLL